MKNIKPGDKFTVAGVYHALPNPDRKWWQFWKPDKIAGPLYEFEASMKNDPFIVLPEDTLLR